MNHSSSLQVVCLLLSAIFFSTALKANHGASYSGVEISAGVQNVSAIGQPAKAHAITWEQRTGGHVRIIDSPFDDLFTTYIDSLRAQQGRYDVLLYAPAWAGDFAPYLSHLPAEILNHEGFDDIHPVYRDFLMNWDGRPVAVPIDGDLTPHTNKR